MKKIIFVGILLILSSCSFDEKGFEFKNFENTAAADLAAAVEDNDIELIREIVKQKKVSIDFLEPKWKMNLLTLAIANRKKDSFLELLRLGADPNLIIGNNSDTSPITEAIITQSNCELFYIETLLKNGANPNLKIESVGIVSDNYYPLFTAIAHGMREDECTDVLNLLLKYGADINCCAPDFINKDFCGGIINECIFLGQMNFLRFFIIEKKIKIPKTPFIFYNVQGISKRMFTLTEILNTEDFRFEPFIQDGKKVDYPQSRKIRNEIINYLKKTGQY